MNYTKLINFLQNNKNLETPFLVVDLDIIKNNFELLKNKFKRVPVTKMLKRTGLSAEQFEEFWQMYKENKNIITA